MRTVPTSENGIGPVGRAVDDDAQRLLGPSDLELEPPVGVVPRHRQPREARAVVGQQRRLRMPREELVARPTSTARARMRGRARSAGGRPRRARTRGGASPRAGASRSSRSCGGSRGGVAPAPRRSRRRPRCRAGRTTTPARAAAAACRATARTPRSGTTPRGRARPALRDQLVAVERAAVGQRRDGHAVVPAIEDGERAGERAAAVAEHAHARRAGRRDSSRRRAPRRPGTAGTPAPARGAVPRATVVGRPPVLQRGEVEPRRHDLAQHGRAAQRAPRGIRRALEREFQQHSHEPRVGRADAACQRTRRIHGTGVSPTAGSAPVAERSARPSRNRPAGRTGTS